LRFESSPPLKHTHNSARAKLTDGSPKSRYKEKQYSSVGEWNSSTLLSPLKSQFNYEYERR